MKASIRSKLENLLDRYEEIGALLSDADIIADQNRFRGLSQEYAEIEPVVASYARYRQVCDDLDEARLMLDEDDADMRAMAEEEIADGEQQLETLETELQTLLLPRDPNDSHNVFLEIRAGTGGDEAAIFAGDLFRMYSRFAESKGLKIEVLNELLRQNDLNLELSEKAVDHMAGLGFDPEFGARPLKRLIQKNILNELSKQILAGTVEKSGKLLLDVDATGNFIFTRKTVDPILN